MAWDPTIGNNNKYSKTQKKYRILVRRARKIGVEYKLQYGEEIPIIQLVAKVAAVMQEYTQSGFEFFNLHF